MVMSFIRASPLHHSGGAQGPGYPVEAHRRHYQADDPMYTVLAGFAEAGENLEQCVAREVFEESGIRYARAPRGEPAPGPSPQPDVMYFTADYQSGEIRCRTTSWWPPTSSRRDQLPRLPPHGTIARAADRAEPRREAVRARPLEKRGPGLRPHIFAPRRLLRWRFQKPPSASHTVVSYPPFYAGYELVELG